MTAILARYVVGAVIAALAAKGLVDQSMVEGMAAGVAAFFVALIEYVRRRHAL